MSKAKHVVDRKETMNKQILEAQTDGVITDLLWLKVERCYWLHEELLIRTIYGQGKITYLFQTTRYKVKLIWHHKF